MTPAEAPSPPGAREVLLRAALGALLGLLPAGALAVVQRGGREWHLYVGLGLFLGGLTGMAGFVERLSVGRGVRARVGLLLALWLLTVAWGFAAIFQAEWTRTALTAGADRAAAAIMRLLGQLKVERGITVLAGLGGVVAAQTLARTCGGGGMLQVGLAGLPLALGALVIEWPDDRRFLLVFGAGLVVVNWASARGARALTRRLWPDAAPEPGGPG